MTPKGIKNSALCSCLHTLITTTAFLFAVCFKERKKVASFNFMNSTRVIYGIDTKYVLA